MSRRITSSQLRLTKDESFMDFIGVLAAILANPAQRVVSVMIVDRSESLTDYAKPVKDAVNAHLTGIKTPPDGSAQYAMVITFNEEYRIAVPLSEASTIAPLATYNPKGYTLLFETVYRALKLFTHAYRQLTDTQRKNLKIAFGIFTDGDDNRSDTTKFPLKLAVLVQEARAIGFEFMVYGFKFNAKAIAARMGMPTDDDHAKSYDKEPASFAAASQHFTGRTTSFFGAKAFRPGSRTT